QATVDHYLSGEAEQAIPVHAMMCQSQSALRERAGKIVGQLPKFFGSLTIGEGKSKLGGGTLPASAIPSITLDFSTNDIDDFATRLRQGKPPVIGYRAGGKFKLDLRTIFPSQDEQLTQSLRALTSPA
ncbi:MAG: hypothetical protein ACR2NX_15565, partial [Chthoniobacterales bacterium]